MAAGPGTGDIDGAQRSPLIADAERRSISRKAPMALLALLSAAEFGAAKVRPARPASMRVLNGHAHDHPVRIPIESAR